jgi:hypothetical protein
VSNVGGQPQLLHSPGRIKPTDPAFNASRKPRADEFRWNGRTLFVVANHFNSKGGDDPLFGRWQPPVRSSETQRQQQATIVNAFVDQVRAIDPNAAIVVLGDLNDFDFSVTADLLVGAGELVDLPRTLPLPERGRAPRSGGARTPLSSPRRGSPRPTANPRDNLALVWETFTHSTILTSTSCASDDTLSILCSRPRRNPWPVGAALHRGARRRGD